VTSPRPKNSDMSFRIKRQAQYLIDSWLAPFIQPRQSILIVGFWRTGSTWLMESLAELLHAKTVFEPFSPRLPEMHTLHQYFKEMHGPRNWHTYLPYYAGVLPSTHPLHAHLDLALRSALKGNSLRLSQQQLPQSFRRRAIVKTVQGQLLVKAVSDTFHPPVILLRRDPRAIMASLQQVKWVDMFDTLSLQNNLLQTHDGREDFFSQWTDQILHFDQQDRFQKIAAYWALLERGLEHNMTPLPGKAVIVNYENLVNDPGAELSRFFEIIHRPHLAGGTQVTLEKSSKSVRLAKQSTTKTSGVRLLGWQKNLTREEIQTVETIAASFGLENRLIN